MREKIRAAIAILVALPIAAGFTALGAGCQDVSFHLASRSLEGLDAGTSARAGAAGSGGGAGVATGGTAGSGGSPDAAIGGTAGSGQPVQPACSDPLTFADPDLESLVTSSAGPIHPADVAGITELDLFFALVPANVFSRDYSAPPVADGWITSLAGVECLTSLEKLGMDPIDVDLGPLAQLPHLTELHFGPMIETTLPRLPQITTLVGPGPAPFDVASTGADNNTAAVLRAFPSLESLDIIGNFGAPDAGLALSALTNLTHLAVGQCSGLNAADLEPLTNLTYLSLSTCGLTDSSFLGYLTQLTALDLSGNVIQDISPLSGLIGLTDLDLSKNLVVDLSPLVANPGIGAGDLVDVSGNQLDCTTQKQNIATLRQRGVTLSVDCP